MILQRFIIILAFAFRYSAVCRPHCVCFPVVGLARFLLCLSMLPSMAPTLAYHEECMPNTLLHTNWYGAVYVGTEPQPSILNIYHVSRSLSEDPHEQYLPPL